MPSNIQKYFKPASALCLQFIMEGATASKVSQNSTHTVVVS